ncbi:MAG: transcription termination/antitermination protein NusA [Chloroflexi bacterium]|nr:transcription termination/antitermination protein NusA [Chloroflexota bacterium]
MKSEFLAAITQLSSEKGVPKEMVLDALKAALVSAYKRNFDAPANDLEAELRPDEPQERSIAIMRRALVVEDLIEEQPDGVAVWDQIKLADAQAIPADKIAEGEPTVGGYIRYDVTPPAFGRIAAQTAKQVVLQKLRDAERQMVFNEFAERKDEIVHGVIQRIEAGTAIVELGRAEAIMPRAEQVPTERYYPGQRIRVYVAEVHDTHRGPQIVVSRAHRLMLRRLFEQEVPEIFDGRVEIKAIAREAGARSKVAVQARQQGIDPVGSCVGMRGVRIQNVVNELNGEKIDVVEWAEDPSRYVANALSPAQVVRVSVDEDTKTATVVVPERQLSLAIGKEGQNARLAAKLTGWRIDIKSEAAMRAAAERAREASEAAGEPALAEAGAQTPGEVRSEG